MASTTRPSDHAVIAHVADEQRAQSVVSALAEDVSLDPDQVTHGTGPEFASQLEGGKAESGPASRVVSWLLSLGQEREELVRLGEVAREGRYGIVINDVADRETLDQIVAILKRHDAEDIVYFGDWQTEDMSIRR